MFEKRLFDIYLSRLKSGGVEITFWDGDTRRYGPAKPYVKLQIKSPQVVRRMAKNLSVGFGESYAEGLIEVKGPLTDVVRLSIENPTAFKPFSRSFGKTHLNRNITKKQKKYIAHHYDIGNEFYKLWLDKSMLYTCAYFRSPEDSLEKAQEQKIDYILRKLRLEKSHSLVDLGCGWGTLLITAAKKYNVTGLGVTLSEEQVTYANAAAKKAGVADKVRFELTNYQDLPARGTLYDRVVSVGMMEHVGQGNQATFLKAVDALLKPNAIAVTHFITQQTELPNDPWIDKYIFPGGYLPSPRQYIWDLPKHGFRLQDYENLRMHYALTLHEWRKRFNANRDKVIAMFDEQFYRMWDFWLASSEGSFLYGNIDLSHFVFTKGVVNDLPLTREDWYR